MPDKFKAFFNGEINLPALKKVVDLKDVVLKLFTVGDGNTFIKVEKVDNSKHVHVYLDSKEIKNQETLTKSLGEIIQSHVQDEGKQVFEVEAGNTVAELGEGSKYQEHIDFFENKIPRQDFLALRGAYFIREQSEMGHHVAELVSGIKANYGTKGGNIVNLCGRGYFETYLRPMYDMLADKPNFELKMFTDNYELIIDNAPFAYFVSKTQSVEDIVTDLIEKIPFSRRYGQHKLNIHAINHENIKKVEEAVLDTRILELITDEIDKEIIRNVLTMTIHFKD